MFKLVSMGTDTMKEIGTHIQANAHSALWGEENDKQQINQQMIKQQTWQSEKETLQKSLCV